MAFLFSALVLIPPLLLIIILQSAVLVGSMYAYHRYREPTEYGDFSFDNATQATLAPILARVAAMVGATFVALHFLLFFLMYFALSLRLHRFTLGIVAMLLVFGCFFAGLHLVFKLDPKRTAILAGANAVVYFLLFNLIWTWIS